MCVMDCVDVGANTWTLHTARHACPLRSHSVRDGPVVRRAHAVTRARVMARGNRIFDVSSGYPSNGAEPQGKPLSSKNT